MTQDVIRKALNELSVSELTDRSTRLVGGAEVSCHLLAILAWRNFFLAGDSWECSPCHFILSELLTMASTHAIAKNGPASSSWRHSPGWSGKRWSSAKMWGQKPLARSLGQSKWPLVPRGQSEGLAFELTGCMSWAWKAGASDTRPVIKDWPALGCVNILAMI